MKKLFAQTCYTYFVYGFITLMAGAVIPYIAADYSLSYTFQGTFLSLFSVGNLLASLAAGVMIPALGRKRAVILMTSLIFVSYLGITLSGIPALLALFALCAGMGGGTVSNVNNAIINDNAVGASVYINLLHTFFACGAFLVPLIAAFLMSLGLGWRVVAGVGLCLLASMIFVYAKMQIGTERSKRGEVHSGGANRFYKNPDFYLSAGVACFYFATENSVNGWVVTYLQNTGRMSENVSQLALSLFWAVMIAGRLAAVYLSSKMRKTVIILICSVGAAVMFGVFITVSGGWVTFAAVLVFGLFLAGIYPTAIAQAGGIMRGSSSAMAAFMALGGLGGIVMPQAVGAAAEKMGIGAGMGLVTVSVLMTAACALALHIREKYREVSK